MVKSTEAAAMAAPGSTLAEAPELLRTAFRAMEGLAAEIQSRDGSHPKWPPSFCKVAAAELESLKTSILRIWFVSASADPQRAAYRGLAQQARDAIYFNEKLQDTIEYHRLQSNLAPLFKLLPTLRFRWNRSNTNRVMKDIRAVNEETRRFACLLDKAEGQSSDLLLVPPPPDSARKTHQTAVFGRDRERDDIVQLLIQPRGEPAPETIVSVVGAGGIGKTTIAQLALNDARVGQHFDVRFWVSASTSSNKMELAAEILRSAQPAWDASDEKKMVDFQMLRRFVASKRCLIVLDDVCTNTDEILLDIITALQSADIRSRILVTSRMNMVPHLLGASQLYTVNPLGNEDCWSLLKEHAFSSDGVDIHQDLQLIGRKITAKTNGSPLSLKLVGGVLRATKSKAHWMNIMETGLQDNTALLLSYKYLPGHLKR